MSSVAATQSLVMKSMRSVSRGAHNSLLAPIAGLLLASAGVIVGSLYNPAQAINACSVPIQVPWSWALSTAGKTNASISVSAPPTSALEKFPISDSFSGQTTALLAHTPPQGYCGIQGSLPQSIGVSFTGKFTGSLGNSVVFIPIVSPGPFAESKANIDILSAFVTESITAPGVSGINQTKNTSLFLGNGESKLFNGTLEGFVQTGLTYIGPQEIAVYNISDLSIESAIVGNRDGNLTYLFEVPGPLPILGAAAAFGYSRKLRKRIKSSKPEVISTTAV